jgi:hypothetical protein
MGNGLSDEMAAVYHPVPIDGLHYIIAPLCPIQRYIRPTIRLRSHLWAQNINGCGRPGCCWWYGITQPPESVPTPRPYRHTEENALTDSIKSGC